MAIYIASLTHRIINELYTITAIVLEILQFKITLHNVQENGLLCTQPS